MENGGASVVERGTVRNGLISVVQVFSQALKMGHVLEVSNHLLS